MANLSNYKEILEKNGLEFVSLIKNKGVYKITYVCKEHGECTQLLRSFKGCKNCKKKITGIKISKAQSHTLDEVKKWVLENSTAEFMSNYYKKQSTDYWFRCECGNGFRTSLNSFKQKNKRVCDVCSEKIRVSKRQINFDSIIEEVKKFSHIKLNNVYRKQYKNGRRIMLSLTCDCGEEFDIQYNNFINSKYKRCRKCVDENIAKARAHSLSNIKLYIESFSCKLLSNEYNNETSEIKIECSCGEIFYTNFINFKSKKHKMCPICYQSKIKNKEKTFSSESAYSYLKEYNLKPLSEYSSYKDMILLQCECGNEFETSIQYLKHSKYKKCEECSNKKIGDANSITHEQFMFKFNKINNGRYEIASEYKGSKKNISITHINCGNTFETLPDYLLNGEVGCKFCNMSSGEELIYNSLKKSNINFEFQYKNNNCKNIYPLPFDFYLSDYNICIEFQGELHEEKLRPEFFGSITKQTKTDLIKQRFCRENKIKLIHIWWYDKHQINKILKYLIIM